MNHLAAIGSYARNGDPSAVSVSTYIHPSATPLCKKNMLKLEKQLSFQPAMGRALGKPHCHFQQTQGMGVVTPLLYNTPATHLLALAATILNSILYSLCYGLWWVHITTSAT